MKKIPFFVRTSFWLVLVVLVAAAQPTWAQKAKRDFYEIKIYHLKDKTQEARVEQFLQNAYVPALHRAGIRKVGVFKPVATDTTAGKRIYVFIPLASLEQLAQLPQTLQKDQQFATTGREYIEAAATNAPYRRMESVVLQAFSQFPNFKTPALTGPRNERIYELRSYEGHTEKIYQNKVQMFNEGGETKIFDKLQFNPVFYGEVLAGSHMPNLMYLTTFPDKVSRDAHWKAFTDDPDWKALSARPEYQKNVSHADTYLLYPTEYSDI